MHGVTTAIVVFLFAGVIWPHLIKQKVQFYAALIAVAFIILLDGIAHAFTDEDGGQRVIYAINALLQMAAVVLCVLSTGMTVGELTGEMSNTIEVVRRGGEKETIIVPLRGEQPKPRSQPAPPAPRRDILAEEAALDAAEHDRPLTPAPPPPKSKSKDESSIPLD